MLAIVQSKIFCIPVSLILSLVLYGCEVCSLILREENRLRISENGVLRRIFGPNKVEDGSWRKFHNDKHYNLYSLPNIFRVIKSRTAR
jgi:hypothetical protein